MKNLENFFQYFVVENFPLLLSGFYYPIFIYMTCLSFQFKITMTDEAIDSVCFVIRTIVLCPMMIIIGPIFFIF